MLSGAAISGIGQAVGGIASMFGNRGKNNPSKVANQYLDQIPGQVKPVLQPYMDTGAKANEQLSNQYSDMFGNAGEFYNNLGKGYKESPGYQFKLAQGLQAGNQASAAGGMLGTNQNQQQQMQLGNDIASQDYNEYMNHVLQTLGIGSQGLDTINRQGYDASTNYATTLADTTGQKAAYGYSGAAGQNAGRAQGWNDIFKGAGTAAGSYWGSNK